MCAELHGKDRGAGPVAQRGADQHLVVPCAVEISPCPSNVTPWSSAA